MQENKKFLTEQIITYIGNKRNLLPPIEEEIKKIRLALGKSRTNNADLFSGSGIVARLMKQYSSKLVVNDLERYAEILNGCYLLNRSAVDWASYNAYKEELLAHIAEKGLKEGIIAGNYAPADDDNIQPGERVFYTARNARYIDTVRTYIEDFPPPYRNMFLAPLLTEASVKVNTAGVFKGFYKCSKTKLGKFGGNGEHALTRIKGDIAIKEPVLSNYDCDADIYREDAGALARRLKDLDIVYIDPPYNQHPYGSNYFMLNVIADNAIPAQISRVSGIPEKWNKSSYNRKESAKKSLEALIADIDSKYLIISYNSEGFVSYEEMVELLKRYGKITVRNTLYNTYRGSRNLNSRERYVNEYLFTLKK